MFGIKQDKVGTALIPRNTFTGQNNIALKTTGDGNCMFNAASIWLAGNESLGDVIRLLFARELFFFPDYNVQTIKDRFLDVENSIPYSEATVFSTTLTEAGEKEMKNSKNRVEAVRAEARNTCIKDELEWDDPDAGHCHSFKTSRFFYLSRIKPWVKTHFLLYNPPTNGRRTHPLSRKYR